MQAKGVGPCEACPAKGVCRAQASSSDQGIAAKSLQRMPKPIAVYTSQRLSPFALEGVL